MTFLLYHIVLSDRHHVETLVTMTAFVQRTARLAMKVLDKVTALIEMTLLNARLQGLLFLT